MSARRMASVFMRIIELSPDITLVIHDNGGFEFHAAPEIITTPGPDTLILRLSGTESEELTRALRGQQGI